uniref:VWFA domain-containing protein n=1 Tax=Romanomermis culicivorax TaxID=13658 RepID=A0A915JF63_ROMCU
MEKSENVLSLEASGSCNSTIADLIMMVDISGSVLDSIVLDRSFIRSVINGFPIDGKNLRMGFIVFSSVCKTLVPIEKDDMNKALEAITRLQDQGAKFFMVLTTPAREGITKLLGAENVLEAVRKNSTDDRMANKIVTEVCDRTCSTEEKEITGCGWDKQGNCVRNIEIKAYDVKHPACKNFKPGKKTVPCPSDVCKKLCREFKWGQWDKACCGEKKGEKVEQTRTRPIPDHLFNEQTCPKSEKFICTVEQRCDEVMQLMKAEEEKRTKSWYIICICLMVLLLILAMVAFCCLMNSRKRSAERFQRRLKAAGVSIPAVQDMASLDEKTRNVLADLPLFSTYQAASPSSTPSVRKNLAAKIDGKTSAAAAKGSAVKSAVAKGSSTPPRKQTSKTGGGTKSYKKKV